MEQCLLSMQETSRKGLDPLTHALEEAEEAAMGVLQGDNAVELAPQNAYIRRLQHQLAQRFNLSSRSMGREPYRRVRIFRENGGSPFEG
jgi:hypothetical protein